MSSAWSATPIFASATPWPRIPPWFITKSRGSRPSASPGCKAPAPPSSSASAKASNNCSRKASSSRSPRTDATQRVPLLGAVGPLQFEVVQYRMQTEYGAESRLEPGPWKVIRWVLEPERRSTIRILPTGARSALRRRRQTGRPVPGGLELRLLLPRRIPHSPFRIASRTVPVQPWPRLRAHFIAA